MERITPCETLDLNQEIEAFAASRGTPASATSFLLAPAALLSSPPVEPLTVAPMRPPATLKGSRPVRMLDLTVAGLIVTKFNPKSAGVRYGGTDYYNY